MRNYGKMLQDRIRLDAYLSTLRRAITPESVVLDLGTGTGIFAIEACRAGARHVYAIESHPIITLTQKIIDESGFADRITVINGVSFSVNLPEKANLLIADLHGATPFYLRNIQTFVDARQRLLTPDATIIPALDSVYVAGVSLPEWYEQEVHALWSQSHANHDLSRLRDVFTNAVLYWHNDVINLHDVVLPAQLWETINYSEREDVNGSGSLTWHIDSPTTIHAFVLWFQSQLDELTTITSAPVAGRTTVYPVSLLPLTEPIALIRGEQITADVRAIYNRQYIWHWKTQVEDQNGNRKYAYQQANFVPA